MKKTSQRNVTTADYKRFVEVFKSYLNKYDYWCLSDDPRAERVMMEWYHLLLGMLEGARALGVIDTEEFEKFEEMLYARWK